MQSNVASACKKNLIEYVDDLITYYYLYFAVQSTWLHLYAAIN